ncbi:hypothetical protein pb186bvf_010171 [Paramecium bursaria]
MYQNVFMNEKKSQRDIRKKRININQDKKDFIKLFDIIAKSKHSSAMKNIFLIYFIITNKSFYSEIVLRTMIL